jgi:hypothetical protein
MQDNITVGSKSLELMQKNDSYEAGEIMQEALKKYTDNIIECIDRHKNKYEESEFYICVQTKRERLLQNVVRNFFYARRTRPEPGYDMACYKYTKKDEKLEFLWAIPDDQTVDELTSIPIYMVPDEQKELYEYCTKFKKRQLV